MPAKRKPLGRGLSALLEGAQISAEIKRMESGGGDGAKPVVTRTVTAAGVLPPEKELAGEETPAGEARSSGMLPPVRELPVEFIARGRYQPRQEPDGEALEELAQSIKQHGVLQPVVVRPLEADKKYELIAGERRWRACQLAGLATIPVVVKEVSDAAAMAMALIENIQRENLNAMEEATALLRLKEEFGLTHKEVAETVGKSRVSVTNLLRLMNLQPAVRQMLERGDLESGHARALLGLTQGLQEKTAARVVADGLSVRQTEELVRRLQAQSAGHKLQVPEKRGPDPDILRLEEALSLSLGARVEVHGAGKSRGRVVIRYNGADELDGIIARLGVEAAW